MDVTRRKIEEVGSCNLCGRGKINRVPSSLTNFPPLSYPYKFVTVISYRMEVRICDDCMDEMIKKYKQLI